MDIAAVTGANGDVDLEKTPAIQVFEQWYTSTLAHEIGHSLGLTHNFQGSFDKKNFVAGDEKSDRNYSTVMDYIPDTHMHYGGPGPYDVHALRAIYTGRIELAGGQMVSLEAYKKAVLGNDSWWKLDASHVSQAPPKPYAFCTDVHVGGEPTCNRWDTGTTAQEIASYYVDEYKNMYPVLNQIGQRLNIRGIDGYVSRIFYEFFQIRHLWTKPFTAPSKAFQTGRTSPWAVSRRSNFSPNLW